jgi:hypothetical protein
MAMAPCRCHLRSEIDERAGVEKPPPDHVIHDHRRQQQQHEARQPREQVAGQGNDMSDA